MWTFHSGSSLKMLCHSILPAPVYTYSSFMHNGLAYLYLYDQGSGSWFFFSSFISFVRVNSCRNPVAWVIDTATCTNTTKTLVIPSVYNGLSIANAIPDLAAKNQFITYFQSHGAWVTFILEYVSVFVLHTLGLTIESDNTISIIDTVITSPGWKNFAAIPSTQKFS